jgi:hypothetical protein
LAPADQVESVAFIALCHHEGLRRVALLLQALGQFLQHRIRQTREGRHPLE